MNLKPACVRFMLEFQQKHFNIFFICCDSLVSLLIEGLLKSNELVSWDEAVRRCNSSSDEPLYLPGFSDEQFQEAGEYMNKHEITSLWINLKYSPVFVWNNGTDYSKLPQSLLNNTSRNIKSNMYS